MRIVDDAGKQIGATAVNFISPSVDPATQSVLVKAPIDNSLPVRTDQFVRTHLVWSTDAGLTIPLVSVSRINGQFFVYVVEKGDGGTTVARQRPVQLGAVVGNDYVVLGGLKEGEQLIVAGIQKIGDGMPVQAVARWQRRRAASRDVGRPLMFSILFIRRPILATVCSLLIILAGAIVIPILPIARYPELAPPSVTVTAFYIGANAQAVESAVTTPLEQAINGVEGMTYMTSSSTNSGVSTITVTFDIGRNRRPRGDRRPEPRQPGARPHAGRRAHDRHHGDEEHGRLSRRAGVLLARQPLRRAVPQQLRRSLRQGRAQARAGRRQRHHLRRAQVRDAAVARSGQAGGAEPDRQRRGQRAARAEPPGRGRRARRCAGAGRADVSDQRARDGPADRVDRVREHRRQGRS